MSVTVFTRDSARHIALVNKLATVTNSVHAVIESSPPSVTAPPKSPVMTEYFSRVQQAEDHIFGTDITLDPRVKAQSINAGQLNQLTQQQLVAALESDLVIVFGSSYIKGWLADALIAKNAVNLHMGISPQYRGSACNFWALFDNNPHLVGATIHRLAKSLDSGSVIQHVRPKFTGQNLFHFSMQAVAASHDALAALISNNQLQTMTPQPQDSSLEIRYSKNADFTDNVASSFLQRVVDSAAFSQLLSSGFPLELINPIAF
jgi:folate-dependent phosphoribosylglycinamide formyltransferase PurN